jgi:pimeloyl-ACP methyl ester carboxylesterase
MPEITLANGVTLAYDDRGDRAEPPIVLLHGVSMSRRYFHKQLAGLSPQHRVLALDLRGHGDSEKTDAGHTVPQYARDLKLFIEALGLEQPVLLGWSMGAFVAWDFIRQFGTSLLEAMVVTDEAASDFKWDGFPHGFVDLPTLHALMTAVQEDRLEFLQGLVPQMFHHEQPPGEIAWMVTECAKLPTGPTAAILFDQCVQDYREVLSQIDLPTLICWGRYDALLPVSGATHLHESIPGSQLVIFEDSGHCPFIEESEIFNRTVTQFVTEVSAQTAA